MGRPKKSKDHPSPTEGRPPVKKGRSLFETCGPSTGIVRPILKTLRMEESDMVRLNQKCSWNKNEPLTPRHAPHPKRGYRSRHAAITFRLMNKDQFMYLWCEQNGLELAGKKFLYVSYVLIGDELVVPLCGKESEMDSTFYRIMINAGGYAVHFDHGAKGSPFYAQIAQMAGKKRVEMELEQNQMELPLNQGMHKDRLLEFFDTKMAPLVAARDVPCTGFFRRGEAVGSRPSFPEDSDSDEPSSARARHVSFGDFVSFLILVSYSDSYLYLLAAYPDSSYSCAFKPRC